MFNPITMAPMIQLTLPEQAPEYLDHLATSYEDAAKRYGPCDQHPSDPYREEFCGTCLDEYLAGRHF